MRLIEAEWELRNLGENTCEITVETDDSFADFKKFDGDLRNYSYRVVKVPSSLASFNWKMHELGYLQAETQFLLEMTREEYVPPKQAQMLDRGVSVVPVSSPEGFARVENEFLKGLFDSDRIALDPHFSLDIAARRYVNWTRDIIGSGGSLHEIKTGNRPIACFVISRGQGDNRSFAVLGGVYQEFKGKGLGFLLIKKHLDEIFSSGAESVYTYCSSNNAEILRLSLLFGYQIKNLTNVFIKHVASEK